MTFQSDTGELKRVLLKHARDAFVSDERIGEQWSALHYLERPDYDVACREYDAFAALLEGLGVRVEWMPADDRGLDSIYVRDAAVLADVGVIGCRMGKGAREPEPPAIVDALGDLGVRAAGTVPAPGTLEGGDATWLAPDVLAVGRGYRTNDAGLAALKGMLPNSVEVVEVPLPHHRGPTDVFHLMSILSPLDRDLLLVYSPLMPVPFRELLIARGFDLVEVPPEEYDTMGCNVLAVGPRRAVAVAGSPETRRRMEAAGVEVHTYEGAEISVKGCGGPTCLTRPLERAP